MSDSVRPHGLQPTRLLHPWDSPSKNTGVGCHFLLQCMKVESESEVTQSCLTLRDPMDCSLPGLLHPWDFPGNSTGVGCHCLLLNMAWMYVYLELIHAVVQQKPTQHCKATIPLLTILKKKNFFLKCNDRHATECREVSVAANMKRMGHLHTYLLC